MATELPSTVDAASLPSGKPGALPETCRAGVAAERPLILDAGSRALYLGPSFTLGGHRNTVAVLAFGLDGEFALHGEDDASPTLQRSALIPPGRWQRLDARGGAMAFLYLDADDRGWRALAEPARKAAGPTFDDSAAMSALDALRFGAAPARTAWSRLLASLDLPPPAAPDPRVASAMAAVWRDPAARHAAAEAAVRCGCAVSTFQRRFSAQAGLPWRRWRLWQRVRHAARAVCAGSDLTRAALDAGFASGAHFSDAFRAMFGLPPSRLVEWRVEWRALDDAG